MAVIHAIDENKTQIIHERITDSNGDQKKLFNIIKTLLGRQKKLVLPDYNDPITLASTFNVYFIDKIANIRAEFPWLESSLPPYSFGSMDSIMPTCANLLERFTMITSEELNKIVSVIYTNTYNFTQNRQKAQHPTHPLHKLTIHPHTPRLKKQTTFNNINYTTNIDTHPDTVTPQQISANSTQIHTSIVQTHLLQRNHNKLIHQYAPKISPSELSLLRETRRTLAQLRMNKSPILIAYLHKVDETHHTSPLCPICKKHPQTTYSTAHTYIPQTTYWAFGCLPREWCLCWSGGSDAWQGFSRDIGLSDPSTATRRRGRSTTTTTCSSDPFPSKLLMSHLPTIIDNIVYIIDRTDPLYLCALIKQQKCSTNTRLANEAFLLKLHPPSLNCSDNFFERSFFYGAPYEWNTLGFMNVSDDCPTLTCLSLKLRRCYCYVISTVSMLLVIIIIN